MSLYRKSHNPKPGTLADWYAGKLFTPYATIHCMADGGALCDACMLAERKLVEDATAEPGTNRQWEWFGVQAIESGEEPSTCDHCYKVVGPVE